MPTSKTRTDDARGALPAAAPARPEGPAGDPPRLLITGPPGSGKSTALRERLEAATRGSAPGRALLLLPTYGEVEHEKRLALSRRDDRGRVDGLLDEAYATFTSLGERLFPDVRVRHLPSRVERDLLAGEALRRAAVPAFEAVRDLPGFRARFLRLVKEMKQSGDDPAALRLRAGAAAAALPPAPRERLEGFLAAWEAYDALLREAQARDHEDALFDLLGRLRERAPAALSRLALLAVDGFDDLSGLEAALLRASADAVVAGGGKVVLTLPSDPRRPGLFATSRALIDRLVRDAGFFERRLSKFVRSSLEPLRRLADGLFAKAGGDPVPASPAVRAIVGADPSDEIDRIGREILRLADPERSDLPLRGDGGPPVAFRDVGIVLRRLDGRGTAARHALEALGIPVRLVGGGAMLASEPAVRSVRGPLRLLAGQSGAAGAPFDPASLLDYLRWRALASGAPLPVRAADAADHRWRKAGFPADWDRFRADLAAIEPQAKALLDDLESRRRGLAAARGPAAVYDALGEALRALLPLPPPGPFLPDGRPRDAEGDARLSRARAAKRRLLSLLLDLREASARTPSLSGMTAADAVHETLASAEEVASEPPDRRLDAVSLLDAEEARHWELGVVFVAGLVEGEFPLRPREDVFLRDADRAALAGEGARVDLRTARDGEDRERRLFLAAATRARSRLYLCRHAADGDGRPKAPSFLWRDVDAAVVSRGASGEPVPLSASAAPADLGRAAVPPEEAVSEADLLRFAAARLGGLPAAAPDSGRRMAVALAREGGPAVARALERAARFRRTGSDPLPDSARAAFLRSVERVSATQATVAAECRHRHFLEFVARVPEDDLPFSGRRIGRRDMGDLVHAALARALADPGASAEDAAAAALEEEGAGLPESAEREFIARDLVRIVRLFRAREESALASGFLPDRGAAELLVGGETGTPLPVGEGAGQFLLKGRVDRVDVSRDRTRAIVVDYKIGKQTVEDAFAAMKNGRGLQLLLYARAVERALGFEVVGVELYTAFVRHRRLLAVDAVEGPMSVRREGAAQTFEDAAAWRLRLDEAEATAARAVEDIRSGTAAALSRGPDDPAACDGCAYRPVCRPDTARFSPRGAAKDAP